MTATNNSSGDGGLEGRLSHPDLFFTDPDPAFQNVCRSGCGFLGYFLKQN